MRFRFLGILLLLTQAEPTFAEGANWLVECPSANLCLTKSEDVYLWSEASGTVHVRLRFSNVKSVQLRQSNQRRELSNSTEFQMERFILEELQSGPGLLTIEYQDGSTKHISTLSLQKGIKALFARLGPVALPLPSLHHHATAQDRRLYPPEIGVPYTKPQIEFAIRAQGGTTFFDDTGR